jgi:uncharacterized membrane protein
VSREDEGAKFFSWPSSRALSKIRAKWNSQASSAVDAVVHAWHVVPTFLTLYNAHIFWR